MADEEDVKSVSAAVEVDRLLEEDGKAGAEKVLDKIDGTESCEAWNSGGCNTGAVAGALATSRFSKGAIGKWLRSSCWAGGQTRRGRLTHHGKRGGVAPDVYHGEAAENEVQEKASRWKRKQSGRGCPVSRTVGGKRKERLYQGSISTRQHVFVRCAKQTRPAGRLST